MSVHSINNRSASAGTETLVDYGYAMYVIMVA